MKEEKKKTRIWYTLLFTIGVLVTFYYQYVYEKYEASWFGINIYLWAIVLSTAIAIGMNYLNYFIATQLGSSYSFDYKRFTPGPYVYTLLMAGCLLSTYLGIRFTEPSEEWSSSHTQVAQNDRYDNSSFYLWYYGRHLDLDGLSSSSGSGSSSTSSDKEGEAVAIAALIMLILFIIALSATVQHFWVVGSIAILLMMAQYLYREWNYKEPDPRKPWLR